MEMSPFQKMLEPICANRSFARRFHLILAEAAPAGSLQTPIGFLDLY
jgi:hypothetical protein